MSNPAAWRFTHGGEAVRGRRRRRGRPPSREGIAASSPGQDGACEPAQRGLHPARVKPPCCRRYRPHNIRGSGQYWTIRQQSVSNVSKIQDVAASRVARWTLTSPGWRAAAHLHLLGVRVHASRARVARTLCNRRLPPIDDLVIAAHSARAIVADRVPALQCLLLVGRAAHCVRPCRARERQPKQ
jgi:hypothetical protein